MHNSHTYSGQLLADSLPGGKLRAQLQPGPLGLAFQAGDKQGHWPYAGLSARLGGAGNRLVLLTHPQAPELTLYTADLAFLQSPSIPAQNAFSQQLRGLTQRRRRKQWGLGLVALCLVLAPLLFLVQLPKLSGLAVTLIPTHWDEKLGKSAIAQYRLGVREMPEAEKALSPLTAPLLAALPQSPFRYQFLIVEDASLNAFALPGGIITLHTGLILKAETPEALLGVVAHEIIHSERRHGLRTLVNQLGLYSLASALLGDVSGVIATLASAAPLLLTQGYSRDLEREADREALPLLVKADIDPQGLPRFFEQIAAAEAAALNKIDNPRAREAMSELNRWLGTHPGTDERKASLEAQIAQLPPRTYRNLEAEFHALQAAVTRFTQSSATQDAEPATTH
jgi:beta-barrel assembly-enhancing protease